MMTRHIMPIDAILVEVVEDSETVFFSPTLLCLTVVWLGFTDASIFGPIVLIPLGGWSKFLKNSGPKPSVDVIGLKVGSLAASEVAEAA